LQAYSWIVPWFGPWEVPSICFPIYLSSYHLTLYSLFTGHVVTTKNIKKNVLQWSTIFYRFVTYCFIYLIHRDIPLPHIKMYCKANHAVNVMLHRVRNNFCVLKVKFSLCFINHCAAKTLFLTLALVGSEWLPSFIGCFTPKKKAPVTNWTGDCVGQRASLDGVIRKKNLCPCQELNPDSLIIDSVVWSLYWLSHPSSLFSEYYFKYSEYWGMFKIKINHVCILRFVPVFVQYPVCKKIHKIQFELHER
jgi:hypothetical protein